MPEVYLGSIEPVTAIVLGWVGKAHRLMKCDAEKRMIDE
jgi:hypothetical protein